MKSIYKIIILNILLAASFLLTAQPNAESIKKIDDYFQQALEDWDVAGMSFALVSADSVLFTKGYGVTDIHTKQQVDKHTLFAVASNTKAFTAAAIMMLVEEGKLSLDDKVITHLPYFALYDPYVTQAMTVRDLLTHRSGLKTFSGDLIWYGSTYSREEIVRKARHLKPRHGFREQFGYSNIMYIAAGELVSAVSGMSWDEFVEKRILQPLGMRRSTMHVSGLASRDNISQPHTYVDGKLKAIPWLDWDNMGPAGSLISSASEMANWLRMNLNEGRFNGKQLLKPESIFEMQSAVTPLPLTKAFSERFPSTHFRSYGLGWTMMDYLGRKIVMHNGGYDGMISQTLLIPEENIGFAIMTNSLSNMYYPLMYKVLDIVLSNPEESDWSAMMLEQKQKGEEYQQKMEEQKAKERNSKAKASLNLADYCGYYGSPVYDSVKVEMQNNKLQLKMMRSPKFIGDLSHWHFDTFEIEFGLFPSLPKGFVTFQLDRKGKVNALEIFIDNPDFDFTELELKKLPD